MKTYFKILLVTMGLTSALTNFAQSPTQVIKGTVIDKQAQSSLPGVSIVVIGSNPIKGTTTDVDGKFKINGFTIFGFH